MYQALTKVLGSLVTTKEGRFVQISGTGTLPYSGEAHVHIFRVDPVTLDLFKRTQLGISFHALKDLSSVLDGDDHVSVSCVVDGTTYVVTSILETADTDDYSCVSPKQALLDLIKLVQGEHNQVKALFTNIIDNAHPSVFSFLFNPLRARSLQTFLSNGPGLMYLIDKVKPFVQDKYVKITLEFEAEIGIVLHNDTHLLPLTPTEMFIPVDTVILREYMEKQTGFGDTLIKRRRMYVVKLDGTLDELSMIDIDNFDNLMHVWQTSTKTLRNLKEITDRRIGRYFTDTDIAIDEILFKSFSPDGQGYSFSSFMEYSQKPLNVGEINVEAMKRNIYSFTTMEQLTLTDVFNINVGYKEPGTVRPYVSEVERMTEAPTELTHDYRFQKVYGLLRTGWFNCLTLVPSVNANTHIVDRYNEIMSNLAIAYSGDGLEYLAYLTLVGDTE